MEETPTGTPVGVDDPYEHVDRCDHLTDDGRCRFAVERFEADPAFAADRRDDGYRCPVADERWEWADCRNFRSTTDGKECVRCGLEERRMAHSDERALIEEHHLSYADAGDAGGDGETGAGATRGEGDGAREPSGESETSVHGGDPLADVWDGAELDPARDGDLDESDDAATAHEITVALCRWCHAKVHKSWGRIDDDVSPDPEALAALEERRSREQRSGFESAADRYDLD